MRGVAAHSSGGLPARDRIIIHYLSFAEGRGQTPSSWYRTATIDVSGDACHASGQALSFHRAPVDDTPCATTPPNGFSPSLNSNVSR